MLGDSESRQTTLGEVRSAVIETLQRMVDKSPGAATVPGQLFVRLQLIEATQAGLAMESYRCVQNLRLVHSWTWRRVGQLLRVSPQGAQSRFGGPPPEPFTKRLPHPIAKEFPAHPLRNGDISIKEYQTQVEEYTLTLNSMIESQLQLTSDLVRRAIDEIDGLLTELVNLSSVRTSAGAEALRVQLVEVAVDCLNFDSLETVFTLKSRDFSWAQIGKRIGISRQGAQSRYKRLAKNLKVPFNPFTQRSVSWQYREAREWLEAELRERGEELVHSGWVSANNPDGSGRSDASSRSTVPSGAKDAGTKTNVTLRLDADLLRRVRALAEEKDTSFSSLVADALEDMMTLVNLGTPIVEDSSVTIPDTGENGVTA